MTTEAGGLSAGVGVVSAWALGIRCIDAVKSFDVVPSRFSLLVWRVVLSGGVLL